ncbi:MAG: hypothetical protein A2051_03035 [Desulfovibrionales bacterium GWA2_65_9]|nr:MAG: hypothetical protein A2051_03035 [Desulfovibrionales bacterium GWA2_65_9]
MPKPNRPLPLPFPSVLRQGLLLCLLLSLAAAPAWAESAASGRLRELAELAEKYSSEQNATAEEQTASRSLSSLLAGPSANSEAAGQAALALTEIALGQGRADTAASLAGAVLDIVAGNSGGAWGTLAGQAKNLLSAATTVREAYAANAAATDPTLPYVNADAFDRKLSSSLAERPACFEVLFPLPVSMKKLPERLDKWLSAIEKFGGKVEAVPVAELRGLFANLLELAIKLYDLITARDLYAPAQQYNATVYYKRSTGTVVKVVFTLREQGK